MKVVSFWQPKGGQGKSTLAINIAGAAVHLGLKPIIIDRDMQGTAMEYFADGNLPYTVLSDIPEEAPEVDLVILDHMASDYDVPDPELLVMPFIPKRSQYSAHIKNHLKAQKANKKIISVVTNGDKRNKIQRQTIEEVKKRGVFEVKRHVVFDEADSIYSTVFDKKFNNLYAVDAAREQLLAILTAILREQ